MFRFFFFFFSHGSPIALASFDEKVIFLPLNCFTPLKKKSTGHKCVTLSLDYLYWSLNLCVYSTYYYSFSVSLCIRIIPSILFLFTLAILQPVPFHMNFRINLSMNFIKLVVQL